MTKAHSHATVFFVHIPKNAGSTMQDILGRQYPGERSFTTAAHEHQVRASLDRFRGMDAAERECLDIVKGHCVLAVEGLIEGPKVYVTFLRDPFQQFKSLFYYIQRAHWNPHHAEVKQMSTLSQFLDHQIANEMDNLQTRHLSGVLDAMVPSMPGAIASVKADEALFAKAMKWMQRMDHVGLTERFDGSLILLRSGLGWKRHCFYQIQNKTKGRPDPELEGSFIDRFKEVYKWDFALYEVAKERFERDVRASGERFNQQVVAFQRGNGWAQYAYRLRSMLSFRS